MFYDADSRLHEIVMIAFFFLLPDLSAKVGHYLTSFNRLQVVGSSMCVCLCIGECIHVVLPHIYMLYWILGLEWAFENFK
jgi:hypothetical protein